MTDVLTPEDLIAAGGEPVYADDGTTLLFVRGVPAVTGTTLASDQVADYSPKFDRQSGHRRVLQAVTDEVDSSTYGPRNSVTALAVHFANDPHTPQINAPSATEMAQKGITLGGGVTAEDQVTTHLGELISAGLVTQNSTDNTYALTDAGRVELAN